MVGVLFLWCARNDADEGNLRDQAVGNVRYWDIGRNVFYDVFNWMVRLGTVGEVFNVELSKSSSSVNLFRPSERFRMSFYLARCIRFGP